MALYAIGDVQGCFDELQTLLGRLAFDPKVDRLWFTGDLVNRGPKSLEVLRFVANLGDSCVCVLGNHDLHLLAVASGVAPTKRGDTLDTLLAAPDCDELLRWLSTRPLLHYEPHSKWVLVHAGLLPQWNIDTARQCAHEVEAIIASAAAREFYKNMYGDRPDCWDPELRGYERARLIVNAFTRLRFVTQDGRIDLKHKGAIGSQPPELIPWFHHPDRRSSDHSILFGHWSTLGLWDAAGVIGLDTGCVWGGQLTAVKLDEDRKFVSVHCRNSTADELTKN